MIKIRLIRRIGIALGSYVIALLVVGLVGGMLLPVFGVATTPTPTLTPTPSGLAEAVVTIVLGGLIYRDIMRREQRPPDR